MVKMIIMDLDGTLLNDEKNISDYNLAILEKCKNRNIKIAIATARSETSAKRIIDLLNPDIMILNGGALVIKKDGSVLYDKVLSKETSDAIIKECINNKNAGLLTVKTDKGYYVNFKNKAFHQDYSGGKYYDFSKPLSQDTYKITVEIFNEEFAKEIASKYVECNVIKFSDINWYRFAHKDAEKMIAIEKILEFENIKIEEVLAFGDDYNDIEMIKKCGIGVAMENGIDEIKNAAKYICKSNNENGVGKWIEENLL